VEVLGELKTVVSGNTRLLACVPPECSKMSRVCNTCRAQASSFGTI